MFRSRKETDLTLTWTAFLIGALVSLTTSWILVIRLERMGERFGLSEALLGLTAALAADAPEITSSIAALTQHQRSIGAGVVIGSNVFNLAALLGLGALVSGVIALHRRVVVLAGVVALWIAAACTAVVSGVIPIDAGFALAGAILVISVAVSAVPFNTLQRIALPARWLAWISYAVKEEELELVVAIHPKRGRPLDAVVGLGALITVVASSVAMERSATSLGHHFHVADAVIGGLVLAAVTSLPNAVAAVYLATKGRGAAAFSTALNSNNLNVVAGLLIPGLILGTAASSMSGNLTAAWYLAMTVLVLVFAFVSRGLRRWHGGLIVAGYVAFVVVLVAIT